MTRMQTCGVVAGCLSLATAAGAQVQWRRVENAAGGALADEQVVFDARRGVAVLFGGAALPMATPYHLAEWDGAQWVTPIPGANVPPGRVRQAMAYDEARHRTVVFGGLCVGNCPGGAGPVVLDSTWEYSGSWTQRLTAHRPAARFGAAMAFDRLRRRAVLFGGRDAANQLLTDTWEYDGVDWLARSPEHEPTAGGPMAFDARLGQVVMVAPQQLWRWAGNDWIAVAAGGPPPVTSLVVYDEARQLLVAYEPSQGAPWEWDGAAWTHRVVAAPVPDVSFAMAYDGARQQVLWTTTLDLGTPTFRDTWVYEPSTAATFVPYGSRCIAAGIVPDLRAADGLLPWLGDAFAIDVAGLAASTSGAVLLLSANDVPPTDLEAFGWPGCYQYVAIEQVEPMVVTGGVARWTTSIPVDPQLLGVPFHAQALVLDAQAPGGALVSNAGLGTVGAR